MSANERNGSLEASAVKERMLLAMSHETVRGPLMVDGDEEGGWIYCYYFSYDRRARRQAGFGTWPCKVGSTTRPDPRIRVAEQICQTSVFEPPVIAFAARSNAPEELEDAIQDKLRHRKLKDGPEVGNEWFETSPRQVRRAYRQVQWPDRWGHRMIKFITMEFQAWRLGV